MIEIIFLLNKYYANPRLKSWAMENGTNKNNS